VFRFYQCLVIQWIRRFRKRDVSVESRTRCLGLHNSDEKGPWIGFHEEPHDRPAPCDDVNQTTRRISNIEHTDAESHCILACWYISL
jgi:hypothetical protein